MPLYIETLFFKCKGCGSEWTIPVNDLISAEDLRDKWLRNPEKMKSCPCGSPLCDVMFKLTTGAMA